MANEKLIAGAVMILLNLVVLAPIATSMVEDAVEDNFETWPYDEACVDSDCTTAEKDWATSTSERSYYAWNLTNADEVMAGGDPVYDKLGPFDYEITTTRNIIAFDKEAGTLTYDESKSFACAMDDPEACNTPITQLNIPFQPQVVGAAGMAINGIMDLTKAGFSAGVMKVELDSFSAAEKTAADLALSYGGIQAGAMTGGAMVDNATASTMIGVGWYDAFNDYFASINGSEMNNMTGNGEMINYTTAIQGLQAQEAALGVNTAGVTFAGNASIGDLSTAFESATFGTENASLTNKMGVLLLAGHCADMPTKNYNYSSVSEDLQNNPAFETGVLQRAGVWGFLNPSDVNATIAMDFAICYGAAGTFAETNGGGDEDWPEDPLAVNASTRIMNFLGIDLDNNVAMGLLFGGHLTEMPTGILAHNEGKTRFGLAGYPGSFMSHTPQSAMENYTLDMAQYGTIAAWAGGWLQSQTGFPMVLRGGSGDLTAEQFVNVTFGAEDPLNGGYTDNSLNLGGAWGTPLIGASNGAPAIALDAEDSGRILYGSLGLTTTTGATIFLYGQLHGETPPINFQTMEAGESMEWNNQTIGMLYQVDNNTAHALRTLMNVLYADFIPNDLLVGSYGSSGQYMTMPLNNWLFGWRDPVGALVAGDIEDQSLGWAKLETNETFYGSGGISTGPATVYVKCTGHNADCEKGEAVSEDGSNELSWRTTNVMINTSGLITVVTLNGTTGGFLTGSGDMVNAGGYAVTSVDCSGTGEVEGIPVNTCSATVDPTKTPITAKLINSETLLDAMTPALPVYFGADISLKSEEISGLIISGSSTSTFYLDTRTGTDLASEPTMDNLQEVFQIVQSSAIEGEDAEEMESSIVQNQEFMGWWMNFDNGFDYVALLLYIGGVALIIMHFVMAGQKEDEMFE